MEVRLVRHATLLVEIAGQRLLVDPMLDPAGARPPIEGTPSPRPNPLVDLPMPAREVLRDVSAGLVSPLPAHHPDETAGGLPRAPAPPGGGPPGGGGEPRS